MKEEDDWGRRRVREGEQKLLAIIKFLQIQLDAGDPSTV